ncbi:hypothetical protein OG417_47605 [Actinoallomurus sp. NBC_01490]|uniref:hypothetical protein n=1 Tax=Actinoallomurus sp. NBC_01490 TaxID=2903557 RepID=UPI002E35BC86|nr:hypothetical protein [Actinoallomurus sp. NBC_01490]
MDLDALYLRGEDAYFAGLPDKAESFLRQAAEAGHVEAACRLGRLHDAAGRKDQAIRWYRVAAERGNIAAMINLAIVIEDGDREAALPGGDRSAVRSVVAFPSCREKRGHRGRTGGRPARRKAAEATAVRL